MDTVKKVDRLSDRAIATKMEKQFVLKYKLLPHLWNLHHPDYNNRAKRNAALDALLSIFRQYKPEATRFHVRQKINILRSCYTKERRKILASRTLDEEGNIVYTYKPSSWKYYAMKFLDEEVDDETENDGTGAEYVENEMEYLETPDTESGYEEPDSSAIYLEEDWSDDENERKPLKRKLYSHNKRDPLEAEFKAIGLNMACKLQRMSTQQRYCAELLVNKVLIKGLQEELTNSMDLTDLELSTLEGTNIEDDNKDCSVKI